MSMLRLGFSVVMQGFLFVVGAMLAFGVISAITSIFCSDEKKA